MNKAHFNSFIINFNSFNHKIYPNSGPLARREQALCESSNKACFTHTSIAH